MKVCRPLDWTHSFLDRSIPSLPFLLNIFISIGICRHCFLLFLIIKRHIQYLFISIICRNDGWTSLFLSVAPTSLLPNFSISAFKSFSFFIWINLSYTYIFGVCVVTSHSGRNLPVGNKDSFFFKCSKINTSFYRWMCSANGRSSAASSGLALPTREPSLASTADANVNNTKSQSSPQHRQERKSSITSGTVPDGTLPPASAGGGSAVGSSAGITGGVGNNRNPSPPSAVQPPVTTNAGPPGPAGPPSSSQIAPLNLVNSKFPC